MIDKQIADKIGVSVTTLYNWKNKYPQIDKALASGKDIADAKVENALFKRAIGYTYEETKREGARGGAAKITVTTKTVPPDVTAQIFWLKNRKPDRWREKVETVSVIETKGLALEELEKMVLEDDNRGKSESCGDDAAENSG